MPFLSHLITCIFTKFDACQKTTLRQEVINKVTCLNEIAKGKGQSLFQIALAWVLCNNKVTSVIIGASKLSQIEENIGALSRRDFEPEELNLIDSVLKA
ncbi:MAG: aldo/keto reductase [Clostridium sp.]|uniref:aldo/keto reductase n=1 Tax=Clostridium sp. TaxID=1506 RepID=UPI003D6CBD01